MFDKKRFDIAYEEGSIAVGTRMVLVDKETGVNYLFVQNGYAGGLTVLVDENGKPVVTK